MDSSHQSVATDYRRLSLVSLIERIVHYGDRAALEEFLENRRPFGRKQGRSMRLVEYVNSLRESGMNGKGPLSGYSDDLLERTCDHLMDKFSSLPDVSPTNDAGVRKEA